MGCFVRTNRHGYLAFRLYFGGMESHEGTKLKDTPQNRLKVEARVRVIDQEIREGVSTTSVGFQWAILPRASRVNPHQSKID
jgi:hypothetical protein